MENFKPYIIVAAKMIEANETQKELAKIIGISRQTLNERLNGKSKFSFKEVSALVKHYNLDPAIFFAE